MLTDTLWETWATERPDLRWLMMAVLVVNGTFFIMSEMVRLNGQSGDIYTSQASSGLLAQKTLAPRYIDRERNLLVSL